MEREREGGGVTMCGSGHVPDLNIEMSIETENLVLKDNCGVGLCVWGWGKSNQGVS